MRTSEVAAKLIKNDATERPVYVEMLVRDANGGVISKKKFPVSAVFSYMRGETLICIEESDGVDAKSN